MRVLRVLLWLAPFSVIPAVAEAQTTAYICTADAQVVRQTANPAPATGGTSVWYTGGKKASFDDCVVGPDGWLYISSGSSILRISLEVPTAPGGAAALTLLESAARGVAFNGTTLYINTASSGIQTLKGVETGSDPLSFPDPTASLFPVTPGDGHGVVFDVIGNLVLSSGATLQRAPVAFVVPFYPSPPAALLTRGGTIFGTAVNTCGETLIADKLSRSVLRVPKTSPFTPSTLASFTSPDYPVAIEVDSNNNTYVLTAQADDGAQAKLWRLSGNLSNSCAPAAPALVVDLSTLLSGRDKLAGLKSAAALGVAVDRTDATLSLGYGPTTPGCRQLFDFGYHTVTLGFAECTSPFSISIAALKSKPTEVNFSSALGAGLEGVRYSPLGGYVVQYVLTRTGGIPPFAFSSQYGFYAQETFGTPGIARAASHGLTDPFTTSVIDDYWDVGIFDAAVGERGDDFSKRVVYNAPLPPFTADCTISPFSWEEPLHTGTPLFKMGQNIKIAFTATTTTGTPCGGGGMMHVSVVRVSPGPLTTLLVQSVGGAQTGNMMNNVGDRYSFNLDTSGYGPGTFQITVWGDRIPPANKVFVIQQ
jgi:hypothetical protein